MLFFCNYVLMKTDLLFQQPKKVFLLFFGLTLLFFGNSIKNGFSLDDSYITVTNYPLNGQTYKPNHELVSKGISGIPKIWQSTYAHDGESNFDYRPLVTSIFAIEYQIFGQNPYINHLINLIIYSSIIFLVFVFTKKILLKHGYENANQFSILCSIIFLIHPSHSEVVNNIKCRDELLTFLFGMIAALTTLKYVETKKIKFLFFAFVFLLLGFFCKLSAILFLLLIPLTIYFFYDKSIKNLIIIFVVFFISYHFFNTVRNLIMTETEIRNFYRFENPLFTDNISLINKLLFAITTFGFYTKLLILPYPLCYYYGSNMLNPNEPISLYFIVALIFVLIFSIYTIKKNNKLFVFGILFFVFGLLPFINLATPVAGIVGERLSFTASYGFVFAITSIIYTHKLNNLKYYKFIISFIFLITLFYNFNRNKNWESKLSLFESDSKKLENSAKANSLLGNEYFEILFLNKEKDNVKKLTPPQLAELCIKHYNLAIKADSSIFSCYNNLGATYFSFYADYKKAETYFKQAIKVKPNYPQAYENLGNCYKKLNNIKLSSQSYIKAITLNPKQYYSYLELIRMYFDIKNYQVSLNLIEVALTQYPNDYELIIEKGNSYMMMNKLDKSLPYFEQAYKVKQNKRLAEFLNSKYLSLNDTTKALFYKKEFEKLQE